MIKALNVPESIMPSFSLGKYDRVMTTHFDSSIVEKVINTLSEKDKMQIKNKIESKGELSFLSDGMILEVYLKDENNTSKELQSFPSFPIKLSEAEYLVPTILSGDVIMEIFGITIEKVR